MRIPKFTAPKGAAYQSPGLDRGTRAYPGKTAPIFQYPEGVVSDNDGAGLLTIDTN